jgi:hypothetical protein
MTIKEGGCGNYSYLIIWSIGSLLLHCAFFELRKFKN